MQTLLKDFSHYKVTGDSNSKVFIFGAGTIGRLTDLALKKKEKIQFALLIVIQENKEKKFKINQ